MAAVGLGSIVLAQFPATINLAGFFYFAIAIVRTVYETLSARRRRPLEERFLAAESTENSMSDNSMSKNTQANPRFRRNRLYIVRAARQQRLALDDLDAIDRVARLAVASRIALADGCSRHPCRC